MTVVYPVFAEFESFRKITAPEKRNKIKEDIKNPNILTGMDRLRTFYEEMGLEFDEAVFEKMVNDCRSHF